MYIHLIDPSSRETTSKMTYRQIVSAVHARNKHVRNLIAFLQYAMLNMDGIEDDYRISADTLHVKVKNLK